MAVSPGLYFREHYFVLMLPAVAPNHPVEPYYHELAAVTSPAQALAVQAKYGITFRGDLAAQLISRHQLHVGHIPQNWRGREHDG